MHDILIICLSIFYCFLAELTRQLLHNLLSRLGAKHPQALVYPLFVALKSPREDRKAAAEILMSSLRHSSPKLVDQALLVSQELIRVAILLQEIWHEALEVHPPPCHHSLSLLIHSNICVSFTCKFYCNLHSHKCDSCNVGSKSSIFRRRECAGYVGHIITPSSKFRVRPNNHKRGVVSWQL